MTDNLPSVQKTARAAWSIIKAIGPLVISQTVKGSKALAEHQMRLAQVEVYKEMMLAEIRTINEVRGKLLEKYYDASDEDRFRIKRDVQDLENETRRLNVYQKALEYLPKEHGTEIPATPDTKPTDSIPPSWMDRFDQLARLQNEAWRQELLSKALARQAQYPGAISPRALWFIGTVDDQIFHAFASLIDISSQALGGYQIPNVTSYLQSVVPGCALGNDITVGAILFLLSDLGLIGDPLTSVRNFPAELTLQANYGEKRYLMKTKQKFQVKGVALTQLGSLIASLYEPKPNELGKAIFDAWIRNIGSATAEVQEIT